jgi:hypothetical protein
MGHKTTATPRGFCYDGRGFSCDRKRFSRGGGLSDGVEKCDYQAG